jgi:hypothetical protein
MHERGLSLLDVGALILGGVGCLLIHVGRRLWKAAV